MAMLIGTTIGMIFQYFRTFDGKSTLADLQVYFDGMGRQMANVVSLIVAGELFAKGLMAIGTIDALINWAKTSGFGGIGITLVMVSNIGISSIGYGVRECTVLRFCQFGTVHRCFYRCFGSPYDSADAFYCQCVSGDFADYGRNRSCFRDGRDFAV